VPQSAQQIAEHILSIPEPKRTEFEQVHQAILDTMPGCLLQFFDGKNESGKIVSNPTIGYGVRKATTADGKTTEQFQIGLASNATGFSVYVMGLDDKTLLNKNFGATLGRASVTGYCIRFRRLKDIDLGVLMCAVKLGTESTK
jgi:hypothetical protein